MSLRAIPWERKEWVVNGKPKSPWSAWVGIRVAGSNNRRLWMPGETEAPLVGIIDTGAQSIYVTEDIARAVSADRFMESPVETTAADGKRVDTLGVTRLWLRIETPMMRQPAVREVKVTVLNARGNFAILGLRTLVDFGIHFHVFGPDGTWSIGRCGLCVRKHDDVIEEPLATVNTGINRDAVRSFRETGR